jgi:ankyrin repeat protein
VGETPLHLAAAYGDYEMMEMLVAAGAESGRKGFGWPQSAVLLCSTFAFEGTREDEGLVAVQRSVRTNQDLEPDLCPRRDQDVWFQILASASKDYRNVPVTAQGPAVHGTPRPSSGDVHDRRIFFLRQSHDHSQGNPS